MKPESVLPPDDADPALPALLAALQRARPQAAPIEPAVLARWLDGRASPEEVAAIETALCDDRDLRAALLAVRAERAAEASGERRAESGEVSEVELRKLEALVPDNAKVVQFPRRRWLEIVACAAAVALVAWPAWHLGQRFALEQAQAEQRELARLLGGNPLGGGAR